jgi:hypothetical protein
MARCSAPSRAVDNHSIDSPASIARLSIFQPAPLHKRLWQGFGLLALILATLLVGNAVVPREKSVTRQLIGHDYLAFYTAGSFVRLGRCAELYDLDAVRAFERTTTIENHLEVGPGFGPWWNPPFYAWVFAPLSALSFENGLAIWMAANIACAAGAVVLLVHMLPAERCALSAWRTWALVPALLVVSMPLLQATSHGQNTCTSLLLLCGVVTAWRADRAVLSGALAGMLFYKPQLGAVLATVLVITLGWRVLLGLAFTGGLLLLVTATTMPGTLELYVQQLPKNVHFMQVENAYLWERHVTLKALWRLMLQGREAGELSVVVSALTIASTLAYGLALLVGAFRHRAGQDPVARDWLIAATIATTPLLMPFYFDYDLLLVAVPAVLVAGEMLNLSRQRNTAERWLVRSWLALYAWMLVNPGLARITHVNLTTILLACVGGQLLCRAIRVQATNSDALPEDTVQVTSLKRAA